MKKQELLEIIMVKRDVLYKAEMERIDDEAVDIKWGKGILSPYNFYPFDSYLAAHHNNGKFLKNKPIIGKNIFMFKLDKYGNIIYEAKFVDISYRSGVATALHSNKFYEYTPNTNIQFIGSSTLSNVIDNNPINIYSTEKLTKEYDSSRLNVLTIENNKVVKSCLLLVRGDMNVQTHIEREFTYLDNNKTEVLCKFFVGFGNYSEEQYHINIDENNKVIVKLTTADGSSKQVYPKVKKSK